MLVLSRKQNECIIIGEAMDIKIFVVEIRGDKVRLGIEAPTSIPIVRSELVANMTDFNKMKKEEAGS